MRIGHRLSGVLVVLFLYQIPLAQGQAPADKQATIAYVQSLQHPEGGFVSHKTIPTDSNLPFPSLRASLAGVRSLKYLGSAPKDKEACIQFVRSCFDPSTGGFADAPRSKSEVGSTSLGLMALVDLGADHAKYDEPALKYLEEHAKSFDEIRIAVAAYELLGRRPPEAVLKSWEKIAREELEKGLAQKDKNPAREVGSAAAALLRMGAPLPEREAVLAVLQAGQKPDGGFGRSESSISDLETSYRIVRCLHMMKQSPNKDRMRAFIASCHNTDGGYGLMPQNRSQASNTYYAQIISHWLAASK